MSVVEPDYRVRERRFVSSDAADGFIEPQNSRTRLRPSRGPGPLVIPPRMRVSASTSSVSGAFGAPYRRDRVYVTTDQAAARSYAALTIPPELVDARRRALPLAEVRKLGVKLGGAVYEVDPIGELTADLDEAGHSWEVPMARIIRVVDATVPLSLKDLGLPNG
jgi:hypothetical protein